MIDRKVGQFSIADHTVKWVNFRFPLTVNPVFAVALREAFLLQRYGGPVVDTDSITGFGRKHRTASVAAPTADYSVQAWVDARAAFDVVDNWRKALSEAKGDDVQIAQIMQDGHVLQEIYNRRNDTASSLVAEELDWRLKEKACERQPRTR